ncbi:helix-turn-helix domain-containing protein [candidate division WOR-3 bacterium]|nr:helix-turn-helix domain-containing protein [candidate division WOR-3 bacterium]
MARKLRMNIGKRIKKIRKSHNFTLEEFGDKIGLSPSAVRGIEEGLRGIKKGIGSETIIRICKNFKVDPNWLLFGEKRSKALPIIVASPKSEYDISTKLTPVPVINEVPAGYPAYPDIDDHISAFVYLPKISKDTFGLYVSGKSMEPEIADGDIVIVNPGIKELKKRELGVFRIHNETTIKRCVPIKDGYILQPTNPRYEPILIHDDIECIIIGKVIYKIIKC